MKNVLDFISAPYHPTVISSLILILKLFPKIYTPYIIPNNCVKC